MLLVANSTPMVDFDSKLNSFLVNLDNRLLLPTPESPISTTVNKRRENIKLVNANNRLKRKISHVSLKFSQCF